MTGLLLDLLADSGLARVIQLADLSQSYTQFTVLSTLKINHTHRLLSRDKNLDKTYDNLPEISCSAELTLIISILLNLIPVVYYTSPE